MSGRTTADEKLERILYLLPTAAREGGATLEELADSLDVDERRVLREVQEVTERAYYQGPGAADRLQIAVEADRIRVWTAGEFARPVRLSPREALAVDLALRGLAAGLGAPGGDEAATPAGESKLERRRELARRLEAELAVESVEGVADHFALEGEADSPRDERIRDLLFRAARDSRWCAMRYLGSRDDEPEWRTVAPYALVYDSGSWYAVARCRRADGMRIFRFDRTLDARLEDEGFDVPDDFDLGDYLDGDAAYDAPAGEVEALVRYDEEVARWIREDWDVEREEDGDVFVRHSVADPEWLVRHVLQYGGAAEVITPSELRERVAEAAGEVL